jgi:hypothetical protein
MRLRLRTIAAFWLWSLLIFAGASQAQAAADLPTGKGLPVEVQVGIAFVEISGFDENAGAFSATVDIRARWDDLSLANPSALPGSPPQTVIGDAARERM